METSKEELEQAKELIEEKLTHAVQDLANTVQQEEQIRRSIKKTEQMVQLSLEQEQQKFQESVEKRFQNSSLDALNNMLKEAIKKDDRQAIEAIMKKMSSL